MSKHANHRTSAGQPRPTWKHRAAVCLLAFVLVAAAVYVLASSPGHPDSDVTASAVIRQPMESPTKPLSHGIRPSQPDLAAIREEIVSEASLAEALRLLDSSEGGTAENESCAARAEAIARLRESLSVSAQDTSSPEQAALAITCTAADADRAAQLVNFLASQYARRQDARRRTQADQTYREARHQAQRAQEIYLEARRQFDRFLEEHFQEHRARAERSAQQPAGQSEPSPLAPQELPGRLPSFSATDAPGQSPPVNDLEWQGLAQRLADLEQKRAGLLLERTPLHPEVQEVDARIAELRHRLGQLSREVPKTSTAVGPSRGALGLPLATASQTEPWHAEAVQAFLARRDAMAHAERTSDQFARQERLAWQQQLTVPHVELQLAEGSGQRAAGSRQRAAGSDANRPARAPLIALLAGLLAAAGVAVVFGVQSRGDLPFRTLSQVQAALPIPIVGVLDAASLTEASGCSSPSRIA